MRSDAVGFFWEDLPPVKPPKKEKVKRQPPEAVWLLDSYLPHLEEARAWVPDLLSDQEIFALHQARDKFIFDIESYPNYFLLAMQSLLTGKLILFEKSERVDFNRDKLKWCLENFTIIGFNALHYDVPVAAIACAGRSTKEIFQAGDDIINLELRPHQILQRHKCKKLKVDCIDLIQLTKLSPGLKVVSARIGAELIMDLPFQPGTILSEDQITITRWYCKNDLANTKLVYDYHGERIELRESFGKQYALDLRSKSDAQMAEAIFLRKCSEIFGGRVHRPAIREGHCFVYNPPYYVKFHTEYFNYILRVVRSAVFEIDYNGIVSMPPQIAELEIDVNDKKFEFGKGGLHSKEKSIFHIADSDHTILDIDVVSFYPRLILSFDMYPEAIGPVFKRLYKDVVEQRVEAKKRKQTVTAEGLKIVVNGSFGKTLEPHSILYQPELGIQTTLTGQLLLLMLIERYELCGISVLSANTDGIVLKIPNSKLELYRNIRQNWEDETGLEMEETQYSAIYSRDVNNYLAFKPDGKVKRKGFLNEVSSDLAPPNQVAIDAVINFLRGEISIEETIYGEQNIHKFTALRNVRGGCVKDGEYLGKIVRWYYSNQVEGEIVAAKTGNKVPRSERARPIQQLPKTLPDDIDREWYIDEAYKILAEFGIELTRGSS